jgi:hypothetical protein
LHDHDWGKNFTCCEGDFRRIESSPLTHIPHRLDSDKPRQTDYEGNDASE